MRTKVERAQLVTDWKNSGLSVRQWCLNQNIPRTTFDQWRRDLQKKSPSKDVSFVELSEEKTTGITLECNNIKIHISKHFDEQLLCACFQAIRRISC